MLELPIKYYRSSRGASYEDQRCFPLALSSTCSSSCLNLEVMRQDGKEITPNQVEALMDYCQMLYISAGKNDVKFWVDLFSDNAENDGEYAERVILKADICRRSFEEFFQNYKEGHILQGNASWAEEKSPYEV